MKTKILAVICPLFLLFAEETSWEVLEDSSDLPFLSLELKERQMEKLRLANGMELLLISDPNADPSGAVVSVATGFWEDPVDYPGTAHFCEHMLFMGSAAYPESNFFSQIADHGGQANAYTSSRSTVYMFSCQPQGFLPLLDRFAHFFIDPLFDPSNVSRELHAVDQEFALQKENDGWRVEMVCKETGNPDHPNHRFSSGNGATLALIPQETLKRWHKEHYGAERMCAAIYSSLPLDKLREEVIAVFQNVPSFDMPKASFRDPIFSETQQGHILYIEPVKERREVTFHWELPSQFAKDQSKAAEFVAYLLERGQTYSLTENLKKEGWIYNLSLRTWSDFEQYASLSFEIDLTPEGLENVDLVGERIFQALAGLKAEDISEALFEEKNQIARVNYQYQNRSEAFFYISWLGQLLNREELSTFPRRSILAEEFSQEMVEKLFNSLTPSTCIISILAPSSMTKVEYDRKETWLQVPYALRSVPENWMRRWERAEPHPDIRLVEPNPFVPQDLSLLPSADLGETPIEIARSALGSAYYIQCESFQSPHAAVHLHLFSPEIDESAKSYVLTGLYFDYLADQTESLVKNASDAGIAISTSIHPGQIHIVLSGFNEKIPLLLQGILASLSLPPPTKKQFDILYARNLTGYQNGAREVAYRQGLELLSTLINPAKTTRCEKESALQKLSYEELLEFQKRFWDKVYIEALFAGNLSLQTAESCWLDLIHTFGEKAAYPKEEHPQAKALCLPDQGGPFTLHLSTDMQGNATLLLLDEGPFTFQKRGAQEVLSAVLHEVFFETLRTQQKTGYIALSQDVHFERHLYQLFLVQSNSHQPEDLLYRFELFLEEFLQDLAERLSPERFETLRASAIESIQTCCHNIEGESDLWDTLLFEEHGDFEWGDKRIQGLKELTYEAFTAYAQEFLSRINRKRVALLYTGEIPTPFTYLPATKDQLAKVITYAPRKEMVSEEGQEEPAEEEAQAAREGYTLLRNFF